MDILPREVIENILSRLPIKALMRCRCVCKSLLSLTHDPHFITAHLNRSSVENPNLILTTTNLFIGPTGEHCRTQLYYTPVTPRTQVSSCSEIRFSPPNVDEFRVVGSCHGLVCFVDRWNRNSVFVCNPCTGKQFKIPDLDSPLERVRNSASAVVGFGFSPKNNEYKVLKVIYTCRLNVGLTSVCVYNLKGGGWKEAGGGPPFRDFGNMKPTACVNGVIHWEPNAVSNSIVCFDIADEVFGEIPGPDIGLQDGHSLAVLSECLAVIECIDKNCLSVWVMKDYGERESWTNSFNINVSLIGWNCRFVQVLSVQKNGTVLMLLGHRALRFYDPQTARFGKPNIVGLPSWFEAVCHVESLVLPLGY